jgi:Flp pilus assembly pilin Flp
MKGQKTKNAGGAAIEYLIVSIFATVISITVVGVVAKISKEKLHILSDKIGIDLDDLDWNPFEDEGDV